MALLPGAGILKRQRPQQLAPFAGKVGAEQTMDIPTWMALRARVGWEVGGEESQLHTHVGILQKTKLEQWGDEWFQGTECLGKDMRDPCGDGNFRVLNVSMSRSWR